MIEKLADQIWARPEFQNETSILRKSFLGHKYVPVSDAPPLDFEVLKRLLRSAAILSASPKKEHRETAYQIATSAAELEGLEYPGVPYVLLLTLSRIGNFPALDFAKSKYQIEEEGLPVREVVTGSNRKMGNTVTLADGSICLTDFQLELWNELNTGETIGISAPTSAGKSYVMQAFVRKLFLENEVNNVAFIVPTRALINQVSADVGDWFPREIAGTELITTPIPSESELPNRAVYVVTQERLQLLQLAHPELSFEVMTVDEAQSIGDGPRGVLLSSVIEEAIARNNGMQLLFAGPNIRDPGNLSSLFQRIPKTVKTNEATVIQNIIFVDCDEDNPRSASVSFLSNSKKILLGKIENDELLTDHKSKLVNLALQMGEEGQNLIYALGPSECEKIAFGLADVDALDPTDAQTQLSKFVKEAVHPKFQLGQTVLKGVGVHFGRLPALVRKSVEDAFSEGHLRYLVTTSTLLYGVNLPAQNLFLHNPQKGENKPLSPNDFWNLAGRAGRLGKEFTGNIFLIDYGDWLNDPIVGDADQTVRPAILQHVIDNTDELISYISDANRVPDRNKPDELENTFVKLSRDFLTGTLNAKLDNLGLLDSDPNRALLVSAVRNSLENSNIDLEVLSASPTVSVHRQDALYRRLEASLKKKGAAYIIPKHPMDRGAYQSYLAAIKRCHGEIMKFKKEDNSHKYIALIALRWMKGLPLPQIIDASFEYKTKNGKRTNISTVIRTTLTEIESDLRFKYVRLFSCYNAVLERVLKNNGQEKLVSSIPPIPMFLEVGACSSSMISFMGLGLSRYTAGKLNTISRRTDMSQESARGWVKQQSIETLDIPTASMKEIKRVLG